MDNTKIPSFFIIGAAKSGTTALSEYLREHKNIFMSDPKEPHFFATDLKGRAIKTEHEYSGLFQNVHKNHLAVGEASVFYLYSQEAVKNIYKYNPNAKIIIMLRNPIEMVYSLHSQMFKASVEEIEDFEEAWNIILERKNGNFLPKKEYYHRVLFYDEVAKYSEQLEAVYKYFPRENIEVVLFDDFKNNTKMIYERVLSFLNIENNHKINFPKINENQSPKIVWFNKLIKKEHPKILTYITKVVKKLLKKDKLPILKFLADRNVKIEKRKALSLEMKQKVLDTYSNDIKKLSLLINKDLTNWLDIK